MSALRVPYHVHYGSLQAQWSRERGGAQGPLSLLQIPLLIFVGFAGAAPLKTNWRAFFSARQWNLDMVFEVLRHCACITKPIARTRSRTSVKDFAALGGVHIAERHVVRVVNRSCLRPAKAYVQSALASCRHAMP